MIRISTYFLTYFLRWLYRTWSLTVAFQLTRLRAALHQSPTPRRWASSLTLSGHRFFGLTRGLTAFTCQFMAVTMARSVGARTTCPCPLKPPGFNYSGNPRLPQTGSRTSRTRFSNTRRRFWSLTVRLQVSHPYRTTGRIMVLYIRNFVFRDKSRLLNQ